MGALIPDYDQARSARRMCTRPRFCLQLPSPENPRLRTDALSLFRLPPSLALLTAVWAARQVAKISIVPRGGAGGLTFFAPNEDRVDSGLYTRQFLEGQVPYLSLSLSLLLTLAPLPRSPSAAETDCLGRAVRREHRRRRTEPFLSLCPFFLSACVYSLAGCSRRRTEPRSLSSRGPLHG